MKKWFGLAGNAPIKVLKARTLRLVAQCGYTAIQGTERMSVGDGKNGFKIEAEQ